MITAHMQYGRLLHKPEVYVTTGHNKLKIFQTWRSTAALILAASATISALNWSSWAAAACLAAIIADPFASAIPANAAVSSDGSVMLQQKHTTAY